jgi:hypothetical protein
MTCPKCSSAARVRVGNHRYDESGIAGITLVNVEIRECPHCKWSTVDPPQRRELIEAITRSLAGGGPVRLRFEDGRWRQV